MVHKIPKLTPKYFSVAHVTKISTCTKMYIQYTRTKVNLLSLFYTYISAKIVTVYVEYVHVCMYICMYGSHD